MEGSLHFDDSGKLLRLVDAYELGPSTFWLSVSCTFPASTLSPDTAMLNLRQAYPGLLRRYPQLRLKFSEGEDGAMTWQLGTDEDIQFERNVLRVAAPDDAEPLAIKGSERILWYLHVSEAAGTTKLRVFASHALCDGRSLFDIFELFVCTASREPIAEPMRSVPSEPVLTSSFGKESWFVPHDWAEPASWKRLVPAHLHPTVKMPSRQINTQWDYKYAPVAAFCTRHGVTVQGVVSALKTRAVRAYNGGVPELSEIAVCTPTDTRCSPYASESHRRDAFFSSNGYVLVFAKPQGALLADIEQCTKELKEVLKTDESGRMMVPQGHGIDETTHKPVPPSIVPDVNVHNMVCASHIGRVCPTRSNVRLGMFSPVWEPGCYWPTLYAFHTATTLSFMLNNPVNIDKAFVDAIHKEIDDFMELAEREYDESK